MFAVLSSPIDTTLSLTSFALLIIAFICEPEISKPSPPIFSKFKLSIVPLQKSQSKPSLLASIDIYFGNIYISVNYI